MAGAKCIEVDNKQATRAQAGCFTSRTTYYQILASAYCDASFNPAWYHVFFLVSEHLPISLVGRRLILQWMMLARMQRHEIAFCQDTTVSAHTYEIRDANAIVKV